MTKLKKPVSRITNTPLGAGFGSDRERRIVITIVPGNGNDVRDTFALKPERCRSARTEHIAVEEVYRYAVQCRVMRERMDRAREAKKRKAAKRQSSAEYRFRRSLREGQA